MSFLDEFYGYEEPYNIGVLLPTINIPEALYSEYGLNKDSSNSDFLKAMCRKKVVEMGINKRDNAKDYYDRIKMELEVFDDLGFVDYILLNWDVIKAAKERGIPTGMGRGSAAGSLVLYLIGVTGIDSLKHELFFERFVSKNRAKKTEYKGETYFDGSLLCDIDNDISYDRRQEVVQYIEEEYLGKTAKILTVNTLTSKLCIKECGKLVDELTEDEVNVISSSIPKHTGKVASLATAYEESEKFKGFMEKYPRTFEIAKTIEGLNKNFGVHPSGIAITREKINTVMPLQLTGDGEIVSGYDMNAVAELAVKFDILGLKTLTVVDDTLKQIGLTMEQIDVDDPSIYRALQDFQDPQGCFQIEADTNFRVCQQVKPMNLEELSAVLALARPGALDYVDDFVNIKLGGDPDNVSPEIFQEVLDYTYNQCLYQEQLMKMANKVGFTLDEAEMLRRIVGKKKVEEVKVWKQKIKDKIKENNLDPHIGDVLWKVAEDSASYSFNKCLSLDTVVDTESGHKMMHEVSKGEMIKAYEVDSGEDHFVEVVDIIHGEKELFEFEMENGSVVTCSMDHKFLCRHDNEMHPIREIIENNWEIICNE